ncbi:MAG: FG-GAP repeat protein [Steroidobacteraceae bacterium]
MHVDDQPGTAVVLRTGAAYVFTREQANWSQRVRLQPDDRTENLQFGTAVALSDDGAVLAVSAIGDDSEGIENSGAVYVFARPDEGDYFPLSRVKANDPGTEATFGYRLGLSGDGFTLAVGAPGQGGNAGAFYLY